MARSWFQYNKTTPDDRTIASNYSALNGNPSCTAVPVNICAVLATLSATQPILTINLRSYLNAAAVSPFEAQPIGTGVKKYVYTRGQ